MVKISKDSKMKLITELSFADIVDVPIETLNVVVNLSITLYDEIHWKPLRKVILPI